MFIAALTQDLYPRVTRQYPYPSAPVPVFTGTIPARVRVRVQLKRPVPDPCYALRIRVGCIILLGHLDGANAKLQCVRNVRSVRTAGLCWYIVVIPVCNGYTNLLAEILDLHFRICMAMNIALEPGCSILF